MITGLKATVMEFGGFAQNKTVKLCIVSTGNWFVREFKRFVKRRTYFVSDVV